MADGTQTVGTSAAQFAGATAAKYPGTTLSPASYLGPAPGLTDEDYSRLPSEDGGLTSHPKPGEFGPVRAQDLISRSDSIIFINGVANQPANHMASARKLAETAKRPVIGVFNQTGIPEAWKGWLTIPAKLGAAKDLWQALGDEAGNPSNKATQTLLRTLATRSNTARIVAHSQGSLIATSALWTMAWKKEALSGIVADFYGSQVAVAPKGPNYKIFIGSYDSVAALPRLFFKVGHLGKDPLSTPGYSNRPEESETPEYADLDSVTHLVWGNAHDFSDYLDAAPPEPDRGLDPHRSWIESLFTNLYINVVTADPLSFVLGRPVQKALEVGIGFVWRKANDLWQFTKRAAATAGHAAVTAAHWTGDLVKKVALFVADTAMKAGRWAVAAAVKVAQSVVNGVKTVGHAAKEFGVDLWHRAVSLGGKALSVGKAVGGDLLARARGAAIGAVVGGGIGTAAGVGIGGVLGAASGAVGGAALGLLLGGPAGMLAGGTLGGRAGGAGGAMAGGLFGGKIGMIGGAALGFLASSGKPARDGELTGPFLPFAGPSNLTPEQAMAQGATVFVNGINTSYDDHCKTAGRIAEQTKRPVVGVYNATGVGSGKLGFLGALRDLAQTIGDKFNDVSRNPATKTLVGLIRTYGDAKKSDGGLRIEAHSQGSVIVSEAIRQVTLEKADLGKMDVTTYGNASWTFPAGPKYHHRVHDSDAVPSFFGTSSWIAQKIHGSPMLRGAVERFSGVKIADAPADTRVLGHEGKHIEPHLINTEGHDYLDDRGAFETAEKKPGLFNPLKNAKAALGAIGKGIAGLFYKGVPASAPPVPTSGLVPFKPIFSPSQSAREGGSLAGPGVAKRLNDKTTVQRKGDGLNPEVDPAQLRSDLIGRGGPGVAPDAGLRGRLSGHLGFDPAGARLHTGPAAAGAARNLSAEAFTIGRDVFFGANRYDPASPKGLGLIGHELTHVAQQTGGVQFKRDGASFDAMERAAQTVGATIERALTPIGGVGIDRVDVEVLGTVRASDERRLDAIGIEAVRVATGRLESLPASIRIEELTVDVELDLESMSDAECVEAWASAIISAARTHRGSATSHAPALQRKPVGLQSGVESLSGLSMDGDHFHLDPDRPAHLDAHAFAQGSDIHLGPGQEAHLPHEAWHVEQQRALSRGQMGRDFSPAIQRVSLPGSGPPLASGVVAAMSTKDKLGKALGYGTGMVPGELAEQIKGSIPMMIGGLLLVTGAQFIPGANVVLDIAGYALMGWGAIDAIKKTVQFFQTASGAKTDEDLRKAGSIFASLASGALITLLLSAGKGIKALASLAKGKRLPLADTRVGKLLGKADGAISGLFNRAKTWKDDLALASRTKIKAKLGKPGQWVEGKYNQINEAVVGMKAAAKEKAWSLWGKAKGAVASAFEKTTSAASEALGAGRKAVSGAFARTKNAVSEAWSSMRNWRKESNKGVDAPHHQSSPDGLDAHNATQFEHYKAELRAQDQVKSKSGSGDPTDISLHEKFKQILREKESSTLTEKNGPPQKLKVIRPATPAVPEQIGRQFEEYGGLRGFEETNLMTGGHSIGKHVDKGDAWLVNRQRTDKNLQPKGNKPGRPASSFRSEEEANKFVKMTLEAHAKEVANWLNFESGPSMTIKLNPGNTGRVVLPGANRSVEAHGLTVFLVRENNKLGYRIHTSYPTP